MSRVFSLNGTWRIATDPENRGREEKWFGGEAPQHALPTRVPSVIQESFPGYHGVVWYWRTFEAPGHTGPEAADKPGVATPTQEAGSQPIRPAARGRYLLRFQAVDYLAEVWVNGGSVGAHEGGESPFVLDATDAVVAGENRLCVRVLNPTRERIDGFVLKETPHRNKVDPPSPGSDFNHGGIFLPVDLVLAPAVRIADLFAQPDWKSGRIGVQVTVRNTGGASSGRLAARVGPAAGGETLVEREIDCTCPPGDSTTELDLTVEGHRLWSLENPYLYRLTVSLSLSLSLSAESATPGSNLHTQGEQCSPDGGASESSRDEATARVGFRDFRVERGFFRINGKRIILKSTHTGNCTPVAQIIAPESMPDLLRRDLLYAKASGYNTVRFIAMAAHPWQLDMCDEIGLMVYEESYAAWLLEESPEMEKRFASSVREMVLRDRNHPSLTIYGMLNETRDGPVFREAVKALALVRSLDPTRLVLLSSGRWDGQWSIGSVSNPGSNAWEHVWGSEAPNGKEVSAAWGWDRGGYLERAGDAHIYPPAPHPAESEELIRTLGRDAKPILLSEYGVGSLMNVIHEARTFEQFRHRDDLEDYRYMVMNSERLTADLARWRMDGLYPFAEDLLTESQERMARHRVHGFDLVRSNPQICGFNLTGMLDHALTGEGMWRLWRDWKPGAMDALQNGWWPLRWCLFVSPTHTYAGRPAHLEAVLANEDVLGAGRYPVRFRIHGDTGTVWEHRDELAIPVAPEGGDPPLAVVGLDKEIVMSWPPGTYRLVADMERGGAPLNRWIGFTVSEAPESLSPRRAVVAWALDQKTERWLASHGVECTPFTGVERTGDERRGGDRRGRNGAEGRPRVIVVGNVSNVGSSDADWALLEQRVRGGDMAVFLSHEAFGGGAADEGHAAEESGAAEVDLRRLPLKTKGRCRQIRDWLYHKESLAKPHPVFSGLQGNGILDWYQYGRLLPEFIFEGQDEPEDVIAAAIAVGYCGGGSKGYESGIVMGVWPLSEGRVILTTFPIERWIDKNPAADRMLLNLVEYASTL